MDSPRPSVLLVDDDPALLRTMVRVLSRHFAVTAVSSAEDVVDLLRIGRRFDVIVSDVWMPGVDGERLHAAVASISQRQARRMVFVTGGGLPARLEQFLRGRPVVPKPCEVSRLTAAIDRVAMDGARVSQPERLLH
jgi:CheY-like chemotaxis protein